MLNTAYIEIRKMYEENPPAKVDFLNYFLKTIAIISVH